MLHRFLRGQLDGVGEGLALASWVMRGSELTVGEKEKPIDDPNQPLAVFAQRAERPHPTYGTEEALKGFREVLGESPVRPR